MSLQFFPNEIWYEVFSFLDFTDIICAFYGLNFRCNNLVIHYINRYGLDFRSISKTKFEIGCQRLQLSSMINSITKLYLSDDDETPYQTKLFLENGFTFHQFTYLNHLSFYELRSNEIWLTLINELSHLVNLTDLKMIKCYTTNVDPSSNTIMNIIWRLPKLRYGHFDISFKCDPYLAEINTRSLTLEHLILENVKCCSSALSRLFANTPKLKFISFYSEDNNDILFLPCMLSLISLELQLKKYSKILRNLLIQMPNLCHLKVNIVDLCFDGLQWENLIIDHLQKLKTFQLKMNFSCRFVDHNIVLKQLITSFSSSFWLEEHKWYIRFHSICNIKTGQIYCHTIPYEFSKLFFFDGYFRGSTCENINDYWSYDSVDTLEYNDRSFSLKDQIYSQIRFPNVRHLDLIDVDIPLFQSCLPNLHKLKSLKIIDFDLLSSVKYLLNQVTHLSSLIIHPNLFDLGKISVYRLNLLEYCNYLTHIQCVQLSNSSLLTYCVVLLIKIENIDDVPLLLSSSPNLRALKIQSQDDTTILDGLLVKDSTIDRVRSYLPITAEIGRDPICDRHIRVHKVTQLKEKNYRNGAEDCDSEWSEISPINIIVPSEQDKMRYFISIKTTRIQNCRTGHCITGALRTFYKEEVYVPYHRQVLNNLPGDLFLILQGYDKYDCIVRTRLDLFIAKDLPTGDLLPHDRVLVNPYYECSLDDIQPGYTKK
ncbi:hypothetical protein I4U23_021627 [Adineta vaga]|nr:hypothetical protein I4U23_021627 [Adineta vaga]